MKPLRSAPSSAPSVASTSSTPPLPAFFKARSSAASRDRTLSSGRRSTLRRCSSSASLSGKWPLLSQSAAASSSLSARPCGFVIPKAPRVDSMKYGA